MVTAMTYIGKVQENGTVIVSKDAQEQLGLQPGDEVQISLNRSVVEPQPVMPNEKALTALRRIAALQEGMRYTDGSQTNKIVREGRDGGMYSDGCAK